MMLPSLLVAASSPHYRLRLLFFVGQGKTLLLVLPYDPVARREETVAAVVAAVAAEGDADVDPGPHCGDGRHRH